jgi:hypothetical protein
MYFPIAKSSAKLALPLIFDLIARLTFEHLVDCPKIISLKVSASAIAAVARKQLFSPHAKSAIVAPSDYVFGMARMLQLQQDGLLEVFRNLEEAQKWLGIDELSIADAVSPSCISARSG